MRFNDTLQDLTLAMIREGDAFEILPGFGSGVFGHSGRVRAGARFFCRVAGDATLLLVGNDRRTVSVPRDVARFVAVRRIES